MFSGSEDTLKVCSQCKEAKSRTEFWPNGTKGDGLHSHCKPCRRKHYREHRTEHLAYGVKYRKTHGKEFTARNKTRREKMMSIVKEAKDIPCADCKQRYPYYAMDFDHLEQRNGGATVSDIVTNGTMKALIKEIEKCEVVCAVCHRIRTHERKALATPSAS